VTRWLVQGGGIGSETICPRCGGPSDLVQYGRAGLLSRWDNLTEICSSCATHESMLVLRDRTSLHPVTGQRRWFRPPADGWGPS
jgi:hypothetical protein